jgi:NAD+ synthase
MLIYKDKTIDYIKRWIEGNLFENKKEAYVCTITGGIDSCVNGAICSLLNNKTILIFMGFKKEEDVFENWLKENVPENKYIIIKPEHPELNLPKLENIDTKESMKLVYLDLYAKKYNALTVGNINKSEYDLVKFFKNRVDTSYDCYPYIDLYRSEMLEIGEYIKLPEEILKSKSITEESFGYSYNELEWLSRENNNLGIVSSIKDPTESKFWALYNQKSKKFLIEVYKMNKFNNKKTIQKDKMCNLRSSMPGLVK